MRLMLIGVLLMLTACSRPAPAPVVTAESKVASPGVVEQPVAATGDDTYFDDRSDAQSLLRSYYNAINRKEYSRAYSYWRKGSEVQPYENFRAGFSDTEVVEVSFGKTTTDAGMSQRWTTVPTTLKVTHTDGRIEFFGGCYVTHLTVPEVQDNAHFEALSIAKARMLPADSRERALRLMASACASEID